MVKIFLLALTVVLAVLGLSEVIHTVWLLIIAPRSETEIFSVVMLKEDGDPISQLHYAGNVFCWCDRIESEKKIAIYKGNSEEKRAECEKIAEKYDIKVLSEEEI